MATKKKNQVVEWDDPPEDNRRKGGAERIDRQVEQLKANPGRWAVVRKDAASGNYITYKKRGCETRTKSLGNNRYKIYAKWPEDQDPDE